MGKIIIVFSLSLMFFSCQEKVNQCNNCAEELVKENKQKSVMYEPSELATLMLEMYAENENWKQEILKGNIPNSFPEKYKTMHSAKSVNENAGGEFYNAMTDTYLKSIEELSNASKENAQEKYNNMVNVCIQCHQQICPGPIPKISKLVIQ